MKISIITINYNNSQGLEKTIKSIIEQTLSPFEFIIIDGGSTDNSVQVINNYSSNVSFWISEKDRGVYHAMNKGIAKASGDFLFFLNSGDVFHSPSVLEEVSKFLSPSIGLIYGNVRCIHKTFNELKIYPERLKFSFLFSDVICHQGIFINKNVFNQVGYYSEEFKITADWIHFVTAVVKFKVSYLHIPLTVSDYTFDGISSQPGNIKKIMNEKYLYFQQEFPLYFEDYKDLNWYKSSKRVFYIQLIENYPFLRKAATVMLRVLMMFTSKSKV